MFIIVKFYLEMDIAQISDNSSLLATYSHSVTQIIFLLHNILDIQRAFGISGDMLLLLRWPINLSNSIFNIILGRY